MDSLHRRDYRTGFANDLVRNGDQGFHSKKMSLVSDFLSENNAFLLKIP